MTTQNLFNLTKSDFTNNILDIYELATMDEIEQGFDWYSDAKSTMQTIADECKLPLHIVTGVCAALSPTNKWSQNVRDTRALCMAFISGGYQEDVKCCTYNTMKDKAWNIMQTMPHNNDDTAFILRGPKITDFFYGIMGDKSRCVIDGHAWCIANNDRRTMQEVPNIGKGLRAQLQAAYYDAGESVGMPAYVMQAATWVAWRRMHGVKG